MNEGLECLLNGLNLSVEGPYLSFEAEASFHIDLVFVVQKDHAFSNLTAGFSQPLRADLRKVDEDRTDLAGFDDLDRHSVGVNALNINDTESTLCVWPNQGPLVLRELTFMDNTFQN